MVLLSRAGAALALPATALAVLSLLSLPAHAELRWVAASNGQVPPGAVIGGSEPGRNLPVCRARYQNGLHPGKVVARNCNIGWGGREITLPVYEVMVASVSPPSGGSAPAVPDLVVRFAPLLRMDRAASGYGYPMSAQPFFNAIDPANNGNFRSGFSRVENLDRGTLAGGTIPTYYQLRTFGSQVRITYWWFYGFQHPCFASEGQHNGDWEHVMVTLKQDRSDIAAVSYWQHTGYYTRIAGPRDAPCTPGGTGRCESSGFSREGTHPIVYSGKIGHGSYHNGNSGGPGGCGYYDDFRNPASAADYLPSWRRLIDLDGNAEPWIAADRTAKWVWGNDGISNHPTQHPPEASMRACSGTPTFAAKDAGCYKSECLAGDDQASEDCLKECRHGYTNAGLTCNKGKWPWEWSIYGRLTGGNKYNYNYVLPTVDVGLSRRRSADSEWGYPN
jgi:hypothetical protein